MFVAWRDLKSASGRFALIGVVVALITLLVGFLTGLTAGLAVGNISAIVDLPGDRIVFSMPGGATPSYPDSAVTKAQTAAWAAADGVTAVIPLGVLQTKISTQSTQTGAALFGSDSAVSSAAPRDNGTVTVGRTIADALGVNPGATVSIVGSTYTVAAVIDDAWYSHSAVTWMTLPDWRQAASRIGSAAAFGSVLVVQGSTDFDAADSRAGTRSTSVLMSLTALPAFRSEIGSLLLIVAMLFAISALVIGAFFTVWSIQRKPDFAVLKALGASNATLHRDALGQAAVLLIVGVTVGIGFTIALGALAENALPFVLSPFTTVLPGVATIAFGLAGAAIATQSVARADPLTALGSSR